MAKILIYACGRCGEPFRENGSGWFLNNQREWCHQCADGVIGGKERRDPAEPRPRLPEHSNEIKGAMNRAAENHLGMMAKLGVTDDDLKLATRIAQNRIAQKLFIEPILPMHQLVPPITATEAAIRDSGCYPAYPARAGDPGRPMSTEKAIDPFDADGNWRGPMFDPMAPPPVLDPLPSFDSNGLLEDPTGLLGEAFRRLKAKSRNHKLYGSIPIQLDPKLAPDSGYFAAPPALAGDPNGPMGGSAIMARAKEAAENRGWNWSRGTAWQKEQLCQAILKQDAKKAQDSSKA